MKTGKHTLARGLALTLAVFAALFCGAVAAVQQIGASSESMEEQLVLDAVRSAALTCYAVEGAYPQSLEALKHGYGLAYNEDLLANWRAFLAAPGCAFCDFAGYHYRQHADSASHRALPPQSIDDQRRAAAEIRATAPAEMQQSVNAFYYEKLVYLASMILRRANAADYRVQLNEMKIGIAAGVDDPQLGRNPLLPRSIRFSAWLTLHMPRLWQWACRNFLKDRQ